MNWRNQWSDTHVITSRHMLMVGSSDQDERRRSIEPKQRKNQELQLRELRVREWERDSGTLMKEEEEEEEEQLRETESEREREREGFWNSFDL